MPKDHGSGGTSEAAGAQDSAAEPPGCPTLTLHPGLTWHTHAHRCAEIHFGTKHALLANLLARWTHDRNRFSEKGSLFQTDCHQI